MEILSDGWAFTNQDVIEEAQRIWAAGGEGVMLKDAESPYQRTRYNAWQKVKAENVHKWGRNPVAA